MSTARKETPNMLAKVMGAAPTPSPVDLSKVETERIRIHEIIVTAGTQMRGRLDRSVVEEYAEAMSAGAVFPPIRVVYDGSSYWMVDGFHRKAATERAFGATTYVEAVIEPGTLREAILMAAGANDKHGLRRSDADKRRAVDRLLRDEEWGQWSDREIARRCAVSHVFVGKLRARLERSGEIGEAEERAYTDKHGNQSTMKARKNNLTGNVTSENGDQRPSANDSEVAQRQPAQTPATARNGANGATMPDAPTTLQAQPATPASEAGPGGDVAVMLAVDVAEWLRGALGGLLATPRRDALALALDAALGGGREVVDVDPPLRLGNWRDGWNGDDGIEYDDLGSSWTIDRITRPLVAMRLYGEEDADFRPALARRYEELAGVVA